MDKTETQTQRRSVMCVFKTAKHKSSVITEVNDACKNWRRFLFRYIFHPVIYLSHSQLYMFFVKVFYLQSCRLLLARSAACRCCFSSKTITETKRESRGKQNVIVG